MRGHEMPESAGSGGSAPSSASSSALTAGCSAGLFLPYQAHQAISSSAGRRSEEHTSELQSRSELVCRLLLEKKKVKAFADVPTVRLPARPADPAHPTAGW